MSPPRIAVTPGDPRGVCPEVARTATSTLESEQVDAEIVLVGPEGVLPAGSGLPTAPPPPSGRDATDEAAGSVAARSIERAVEMALAGDIQ